MTDIAANSEYFVEAEVADHGAEIARTLVAEHRIVNAQSSALRYLTSFAAGKTDANGYVLLSFPPTPQGFNDSIKCLMDGGPTPISTAPGEAFAAILSGQSLAGDAALPTPYVFDILTPLPAVVNYGANQNVVLQGQQLAVQVYDSGTSQDPYIAVARYWRMPYNFDGSPAREP